MPIIQLVDHSPNVRELVFKSPEEFSFKAGQFVTLHVPQDPKPALRAYSIASDENKKNELRLLIKYVENGVASNFVWNLKGQETLNFTGPFGRVFFQEPPTDQVIFVNTGTGIAQHYSYLLSKAQSHSTVRYRMLFGLRCEQDIYFQQELSQLKSALHDFDFEYVLSRPSDDWTGKKGYVQHFIDQYNFESLPTTFYLCGNGNMIKEIKQYLIEEKSFDKSKIFSEAFD